MEYFFSNSSGVFKTSTALILIVVQNANNYGVALVRSKDH